MWLRKQTISFRFQHIIQIQLQRNINSRKLIIWGSHGDNGIWRCVVWWIGATVSEERSTSVFKVEGHWNGRQLWSNRMDILRKWKIPKKENVHCFCSPQSASPLNDYHHACSMVDKGEVDPVHDHRPMKVCEGLQIKLSASIASTVYFIPLLAVWNAHMDRSWKDKGLIVKDCVPWPLSQ
jgi:hypothetical protein